MNQIKDKIVSKSIYKIIFTVIILISCNLYAQDFVKSKIDIPEVNRYLRQKNKVSKIIQYEDGFKSCEEFYDKNGNLYEERTFMKFDDYVLNDSIARKYNINEEGWSNKTIIRRDSLMRITQELYFTPSNSINESYEYKYIDNKKITVNYNYNGRIHFQDSTIFDTCGNFSESFRTYYPQDNPTVFHYTKKYNALCNETEETNYTDGNFKYKIIYDYNYNSFEINVYEIHKGDKKYRRTEHIKYDTLTRTRQKYIIEDSGVKRLASIIIYNENGQIYSHTIFKPDGSIEDIYIINYNTDGNETAFFSFRIYKESYKCRNIFRKYNDKGLRTESKIIDNDGNIESLKTYEYEYNN